MDDNIAHSNQFASYPNKLQTRQHTGALERKTDLSVGQSSSQSFLQPIPSRPLLGASETSAVRDRPNHHTYLIDTVYTRPKPQNHSHTALNGADSVDSDNISNPPDECMAAHYIHAGGRSKTTAAGGDWAGGRSGAATGEACCPEKRDRRAKRQLST